MGITAEQIQLKNVHPPGPVQRSFDEVNRAQQEREQVINEANGEYNRVIPKAKGTAEQRISGAEGYAFQRVNEAEGDVDPLPGPARRNMTRRPPSPNSASIWKP